MKCELRGAENQKSSHPFETRARLSARKTNAPAEPGAAGEDTGRVNPHPNPHAYASHLPVDFAIAEK